MTVALVLFTCFVCPLVEMFDQWDHTIQTGNDIEYALVVLALCVGVAHTVTRFISGFPCLSPLRSLFPVCPPTRPSPFAGVCPLTLLLFL